MNCPMKDQSDSEILMDLGAGKTSAQTEALRQHAHECVDCKTFLAEQAGLWSTLDEFEPEEISQGFDRRVLANVEQAAPGSWAQSLWKQFWKPLVPLAVTGTAVLAFFLLRAPEVQAPATEPMRVEANFDVDEVEQTLEDLEMLEQLTPVVMVEDL